MKQYKRIELIVAIILLTVSSIAALVLSGVATYSFFLEFGWLTALAAVLTVEVGILGAVFSIRTKHRRDFTGIGGWAVVIVSILLEIVIAMGANFLYKVETLGFGISEQFISVVRIGTTTFIIPIVALLNLERLRIAVSSLTNVEVRDDSRSENTLPHDRVQYYIDRFGEPDKVPIEEMAELFDRSVTTIKRDLEKMRERMKGF